VGSGGDENPKGKSNRGTVCCESHVVVRQGENGTRLCDRGYKPGGRKKKSYMSSATVEPDNGSTGGGGEAKRRSHGDHLRKGNKVSSGLNEPRRTSIVRLLEEGGHRTSGP